MEGLLLYVTLFLLGLVCGGVHLLAWKWRDKQTSAGNNPNFVTFQRQYFSAYFLALIADWLQGPYLYKLYSHYHFEEAQIAVIYVCGFASTVIVGTWAPIVAKRFGRQKLCIVFTLLYSVSCFMKLSYSYPVLILSRIFSGIATSLLFSSYEAWYIHEHIETHDFPQEWIAVTMQKVSVWNGGLAVLSGFIANIFADWFGLGPVAPFMIAVPFLLLSGIVVMSTWNENYGVQKVNFRKTCTDGLREIGDSKRILLVGAIQALFESVLYIFVFLWTPLLDNGQLPLGIMFACFMVCTAIGSGLHEIALKYIQNITCLIVAIFLGFVASCLCAVFTQPIAHQSDFGFIFVAFIVYELSVGIYFASMAQLRKQVFPDQHVTSIMNWFRVPLNLIACFVLMLLHDDNFRHGNRFIFIICSSLLCGALVCTGQLMNVSRPSQSDEENMVES